MSDQKNLCCFLFLGTRNGMWGSDRFLMNAYLISKSEKERGEMVGGVSREVSLGYF